MTKTNVRFLVVFSTETFDKRFNGKRNGQSNEQIECEFFVHYHHFSIVYRLTNPHYMLPISWLKPLKIVCNHAQNRLQLSNELITYTQRKIPFAKMLLFSRRPADFQCENRNIYYIPMVSQALARQNKTTITSDAIHIRKFIHNNLSFLSKIKRQSWWRWVI